MRNDKQVLEEGWQAILTASWDSFTLTLPSCKHGRSQEGWRWRMVWHRLPGIGMAGYVEHRAGFREFRVFLGGN